MKHSVWSDSVKLPEFKTLHGDKKTDVLIIGGGICGILTGYLLKQSGIDCILVEANRIASGMTKNTTAKITSQHGLLYAKLQESYGKEYAKKYLYANQLALQEYERLSQIIDCDFVKKDAFTYSTTDREVIETEVQVVRDLGLPADYVEAVPLPFATKGAIRFPNQAEFHPLKFIKELVKDLTIYENTFIKDITPSKAVSASGSVTAKKIIITTHFPFINKHGGFFLKLYQHRSYVLALENASALAGMYVDADKKGMSFRSYDNLLLLGGGGHRTGKHGGTWTELYAFQKEHYPHAKPVYEWSAQDCMSLDGVPYIGLYSPRTPNLYVATGFNKWGMTSSMAAAQILTDMLKGKSNPYADVFSPARSIWKPQLLINSFEAALHLLTPSTKRCPHLGCSLKWNRAEHSWDCPCHGSRFEEDGKLIDNPATGDAMI